jgi:hypothetical protein
MNAEVQIGGDKKLHGLRKIPFQSSRDVILSEMQEIAN